MLVSPLSTWATSCRTAGDVIRIIAGDEDICVVGAYVLLYAVKAVAVCIAFAAVAAAQVYRHPFHSAGVGGGIRAWSVIFSTAAFKVVPAGAAVQCVFATYRP